MTDKRPRRKPVPTTDPYAGKTDLQVLEIAKGALRAAESLPPRSYARRKQWEIFDSAMGEAMRRAMMQALWKLHEGEEPPDEQIVSEVETIIRLAEEQRADPGVGA